MLHLSAAIRWRINEFINKRSCSANKLCPGRFHNHNCENRLQSFGTSIRAPSRRRRLHKL